MRKLLQVIFLVLGAASLAHGQAWSGVLDSSRAIDWSLAGAGTIPPRATICSTPSLTASSSSAAAANGAAIRSAIAGCAAGQTVSIPGGTYYVDYLWFGTSFTGMVSNVTLRGAGANATFIIITTGDNCTGLGAAVCLVNSYNNFSGSPGNTATWTAGYSKGATSITLNSVSGTAPVAGELLILDQLDDTFTTGDTGNIFVCQSAGVNGDCSQQGGSGNGRPGVSGCSSGCRAQNQIVQVTAISGSGAGPYTVTISPGLYASNWRSGSSPGAWWASAQPISGDGIENMSLDYSGLTRGVGINITNGYGNWISNVRGVNSVLSSHVQLFQSAHNTVQNSYFYGSTGASSSYGVDTGNSSGDNLIQNNICQHISTCEITEGDSGSVFAYNYAVDDYFTDPTWQQESDYHHSAGDNFTLREGNQGDGWYADDIHGTSFMLTVFRNYYSGRDPALTGGTAKTQQTSAIVPLAFNREINIIGNVLGTPGYHTIYQTAAPNSTDCGNAANSNLSIYVIGYSGSQGLSFTCGGGSFSIPNDTAVASTMLRWGNYDTVHATPQFNSSEVPSGLSVYANAVPSTHVLPPSFFMSGLSAPVWYTTSSGNRLLYPVAGPDVSSGNIAGMNGYANLNPAGDCALNIMNINPNGSSGAQPYDAYTICGYGSPAGAPSVTFSSASGGASITSYTWSAPVLIGSGSPYQTIYVNNTGTGTLNITLPISLTTATDFVFVDNQCGSSGGVVAPGSSCYLQLQFVPTATGTRTDTITLTGNAGSQTFTVHGTGTGAAPPPNPPSNLMFILASARQKPVQPALERQWR